MGSLLYSKILGNDVQFTIGVYLRALTDTGSFNIIEFQNLFTLKRVDTYYVLVLNLYTLDLSNSPQSISLKGYSIGSYTYLHIVIDQVN